MRRFSCILALFLALISLVACGGDEPTPTPGRPVSTVSNLSNLNATTATTTTAARSTTTSASTTTVAPSTSATSNGSAATATVNVTTAATTAPPTTVSDVGGVPVYSELKPLDFGPYTAQFTQQFSQPGGNPVQTATFSTRQNFPSLAAFYNDKMAQLGYDKAEARDLPQNAILNGKVLLYGKGSGAALQGVIIIQLGPLDAATLQAFSATAPDTAKMRAGDSIVVILSGITGSYLDELQKDFSGASSSTPTPTL